MNAILESAASDTSAAAPAVPHLQLQNVSLNYGQVRALQDVSLRVDQGSVVALIGANGAGKSSTLRAVTGLSPVCGGKVLLNGGDVTGTSAHKLVEQGVAMVPEGRHVFPFMSIKDNLLMGAYTRSDKGGIAADLDKVLTRFPRLKERFGQQASSLSGGEQQMVAIGRALMARPRLLLLDEPSLGIAPQFIRLIARTILEINKDEGVTIMLVEQNSRMALMISRYAYILATGRIELEGVSRELLDHPDIKRLYLGA
ncbi:MULTISPECIES: ABC transporter ATP-binding protein [unclassified Herbaspirillum]|jgi:branched-chain amino acid transport system ATP-binding protein|uniref:ABC transporter ATP-binding protein n=1 Tax=unclassified Herbaspirillum TaxID=2624150 RepID=UPI000E2ED25F|nr:MULTISPECIES: ABC transporter ATP-binding protein [unclassified Herbaspirillum]RFB65772.1 ABC transporter ATP-binding protein [Herbaspirillum sp. 3R-3a1]TFI08923.1 ABC transporter ATP-binding protein [Herbaspirillum sp. 3R11]TFI15341.1 ABC transporter ATP-binding protein [Herbaspirillum sp. 3R-11]TFI24134.1 ABC transporter ATP-binding protein [Herbaspirillum sp. 3C11]